MRLDGNSVLIADADYDFSDQLKSSLSQLGANCFQADDINEAKALLGKHDFDVIVSNYYLSDGIIHELIDWCSKNLESLPIFTCVGYPLPTDSNLSKKHSISDIFSKNDPDRIAAGLSRLLFDFNEFHLSLLEIMTPKEITIEILVDKKSFMVRPTEISDETLLFDGSSVFQRGSFVIMKFSLLNEEQTQNFIIPGFVESHDSMSTTVQIDKAYLHNWKKFRNYLETKQVKISQFLKKASGL